MRPIDELRQACYGCLVFEENGPRRMIDSTGVDRVLFETDFPHPSCLYPRSREHLHDVMGDLPGITRRNVPSDNAAALHGTSVD